MMRGATHSVRPVRGRGEGGVALLVVVMVIALITIVVSEFSYRSGIELAAATNFRDELRAQYLLRSSANLARLLFKVQEKIVEPYRKFLGDVQVPHYAPYLIGAFAEKDQADALGSLLGVDTASAKGLGIDGGTIDAEIDAEDGKLNLNCAGGMAPDVAKQRLATALLALLSPAQYNPLFEEPDDEGNRHDRPEVVQALIDWADADEARFGVTSAPEDYGYESGRDPYHARNNYYDTPGEIQLVRGVDDRFVHAFGDSLTIWGGCGINVNEAPPFVLLMLILEYAQNPEEFQNPQRVYDALQLALYLYEMRTLFGAGFSDVGQVVKAIENPESLALPEIPGLVLPVAPPQGIAIKEREFKQVATAGRRRVWRVKATAEIGHVRRQLLAVWDMAAASQSNQSAGAWVYWREQ
jgi:type II secretory pathway component PulK